MRSSLLSSLVPVVLALAGCGEYGGPVDPPDLPALPAVDSATVLEFGGTTNVLMQRVLHTVLSGQHLGTPDPFLLPSLGAPATAPQRSIASVATACAPAQTGVDSFGVAIDSDLDGVPDDNTVDFGPGCTVLDGGLEYTFSGKYQLRDPGNGVMDWEYTTTALSAQVRDTLTGDFFRQQVTGTEVAHFLPTSATHLVDVTQDVAFQSGAGSGHLLLRTREGSTYTPSAGSSFQLHATLPQGSLSFAVDLTLRDLAAGADSLRFVVSTPTPVHTSFACGSGIDAGQLRGRFEGDDRVGFRYLWSGCAPPELQLFGTTP